MKLKLIMMFLLTCKEPLHHTLLHRVSQPFSNDKNKVVCLDHKHVVQIILWIYTNDIQTKKTWK